MKQKFFYTLYILLFIFALGFGLFLMHWTIHNTNAVDELEGQVYQLTLDYQIKVQEIVELKQTISTLEEENNSLKVYISSLEKFN